MSRLSIVESTGYREILTELTDASTTFAYKSLDSPVTADGADRGVHCLQIPLEGHFWSQTKWWRLRCRDFGSAGRLLDFDVALQGTLPTGTTLFAAAPATYRVIAPDHTYDPLWRPELGNNTGWVDLSSYGTLRLSGQLTTPLQYTGYLAHCLRVENREPLTMDGSCSLLFSWREV